MRDNIIPFNQNNEDEDYCCESCDLAQEYFFMLLDKLENSSFEEAYGVVRELVEEAKNLALIEFLEHEMEYNADLLDRLKYGDFED